MCWGIGISCASCLPSWLGNRTMPSLLAYSPAKAAALRAVVPSIELLVTDSTGLLSVWSASLSILKGAAQGAEGTEVSMTVQPRGSNATRQLALTRRKVKFNPVTSRLCGGAPRTGYLRVSTFSKQTAEGVAAAMQELKVRFCRPSVLRCSF